MDQRTPPAPRLAPLPPEHSPELAGHFETARKRMGFVPNSMLIMQRSPKMVRGFTEMSAAIWDPQGKVDLKLKRLISHVASRSAGCRYCMAHTAEGAVKVGVDEGKLVRSGTTRRPLFSAAGARPCVGVAAVRAQYHDRRHVHGAAQTLSGQRGRRDRQGDRVFSFLNRWNDTFETPLRGTGRPNSPKSISHRTGWMPASFLTHRI
jgi:alkylhydroperoxidase family enzyme